MVTFGNVIASEPLAGLSQMVICERWDKAAGRSDGLGSSDSAHVGVLRSPFTRVAAAWPGGTCGISRGPVAWESGPLGLVVRCGEEILDGGLRISRAHQFLADEHDVGAPALVLRDVFRLLYAGLRHTHPARGYEGR